MNQIFRLSGGQPAVKFNLSDVISIRVGQLLISNTEVCIVLHGTTSDLDKRR